MKKQEEGLIKSPIEKTIKEWLTERLKDRFSPLPNIVYTILRIGRYSIAIVMFSIATIIFLGGLILMGFVVYMLVGEAYEAAFGPVRGPAVYTIAAWDLCAEYENNAMASDYKYRGSIVKVSGRVNEIRAKNLTLQGCESLVYQLPDSLFYEKDSRRILRKLATGQPVSVTGKVTEFKNGVAVINRCIVNGK